MLESEDAISWNNRGITLHSQKKYHDALEAYDRAIALDPDEPIFHANKQKVLSDILKKKPESTSQKKSDSLSNSDHDDAISWNNKGYSLSGQGYDEEALLAYEHAIKLDPDNLIFWKNKAKALEALKQKSESHIKIELSDLFEPIQSDVNYSEAINWNNRGYGFAESGDHERALSAYNQAIQFNPNFAEAWNNMGYSLLELGKIEEAIDCIHKAIKINPEMAKPWIQKLVLLTYLVKNDNALEAIFKMSK